MRDSLRLAVLFGSIFCVALAVPACGGDDESDDGTKTGGGTGGGVIGGTGGGGTGGGGSGGTSAGGGTGGSSASGGSGGGTGGSSTITCGTETCEGFNIAGFLTIEPCCPSGVDNKCGADVPDFVAGVIGVPAGCYELEQEGPLDTSCPPLSVAIPIGDGGNIDFPGCCNTATGMCGNVLDTSSFGGPNFGCASVPLDGGTPTACGGSTDGGTGGSAGAAGDGGPVDASTD